MQYRATCFHGPLFWSWAPVQCRPYRLYPPLSGPVGRSRKQKPKFQYLVSSRHVSTREVSTRTTSTLQCTLWIAFPGSFFFTPKFGIAEFIIYLDSGGSSLLNLPHRLLNLCLQNHNFYTAALPVISWRMNLWSTPIRNWDRGIVNGGMMRSRPFFSIPHSDPGIHTPNNLQSNCHFF